MGQTSRRPVMGAASWNYDAETARVHQLPQVFWRLITQFHREAGLSHPPYPIATVGTDHPRRTAGGDAWRRQTVIIGPVTAPTDHFPRSGRSGNLRADRDEDRRISPSMDLLTPALCAFHSFAFSPQAPSLFSPLHSRHALRSPRTHHRRPRGADHNHPRLSLTTTRSARTFSNSKSEWRRRTSGTSPTPPAPLFPR